MQKDPEILFTGEVKNQQCVFDKPLWWNENLKCLEGKRFDLTICEHKRTKSPPQLALYFGIIIKKYCMLNSQFAGWEWFEIDKYIRDNVASYPKTFQWADGRQRTIIVNDEISGYLVDQMNVFIEKVLQFLAEQHDIYIDDPVNFKLNKYLKQE